MQQSVENGKRPRKFGTISEERIYDNTARDKIIIDNHKLALILNDDRKYSPGIIHLQTCLGIFVTAGTTLLTANFKDTWLLSSAGWVKVFQLITFGSLLAMGYLLRKDRKRKTVDELVKEIRGDNEVMLEEVSGANPGK